MANWSVMDREWPFNQFDPYQFPCDQYYQENQQAPPCNPPAQPPLPTMPPPPAQTFQAPSPALAALLHQDQPSTSRGLPYPNMPPPPLPRGDNPREIRNKAEKQRRDKLNQSIGELASMVPPVVAASRKIDKTGVLRLTAHYLRAHQYVFGDSIGHDEPQFSAMSTRALLTLLNGFLLTTTYRGLIVVVSQNVQKYLGYSELDLLGQSVFNVIHEDDRQLMRDQLMPKKHMLGPNGELLVPEETEGKKKVADELANEKRRFIIRFKKLSQRSEPCQYVTCHVEGSLRKSDRACRGYNRCCQMVRRARARGDNPCSSGNDIVFVGVVRVATESFIKESNMEAHRMEYRTRHSIDGQIIQTEQRISLVTGYMTHEVKGINAMNFMHRDDVRWVVIALREMYDQHRLVGESCYRLMTKNGQFIYMKTRGRLEVDPAHSRAVTSFVCTNTVVDEHEGKHLIKMMKKKFMLMVNNNEEPPAEEETKDGSDQSLSVEDPRQLEKVILHLVTNLPSPQSEEDLRGESPDRSVPASARLAIIPPKKERIVSAIEKIYSVIKTFPSESNSLKLKELDSGDSASASNQVMTYRNPSASHTPQMNPEPAPQVVFTPPKEPKLPNFNDVYTRRHSESTVTMHDLNKLLPLSALHNNAMSLADMRAHNFTSTATLSVQTATNEPGGHTFKYRLFVRPNNPAFQTSVIDRCVLLQGPAPLVAGNKRPREYTDLDAPYAHTQPKRRYIEVQKDEDAPVDAPLLDSLLDEALIAYPQIETVINSLEQNIDPTFPDLLVSQEVEEILHEIEEGSGNDKTDT
ncbi:circadian locomoter output cycles protein kaput-like isoform X1 [Ostrinia nubilalis]|uniref:circadian locomoter output cycles protein kaput-like isoform X1 n=1 Tax=Ostrinia nubilalis TaxID=29057 RepID=UPI0030824919